MTRSKNQNNNYTSITIEEDPLNIMNISSSLLEDDNAAKSFLMDDDENFLATTLGGEEMIPLSSPESSQDVPATPPRELYNILQNLTTQPPTSQIQTTHGNDFPPFGVVDLHGTMFTQPTMQPQNFYAPQEFFPQMMMQPAEFNAYFSAQPHVLVQPPPPMMIPKQEVKLTPPPKVTDVSDEDDEGDDSPHRGDEPPRKRRKRKNEEIDEDNDRLNELCSKPNAQLTEEEKQEKRRLRNRQTAQRSRNNQKVKLDSLEKENNDLRKKNTKLQAQLEESTRQCDLLRKENQLLKDQIRKNVTIDVPSMIPSVPIVQPGLKTSQKVTMLMAIVFCVGCTFFLGNMAGDKGLVRQSTVTHIGRAVPNEVINVRYAAQADKVIIPPYSGGAAETANSITQTAASAETAKLRVSPPSLSSSSTSSSSSVKAASSVEHRTIGRKLHNYTDFCQPGDNLCYNKDLEQQDDDELDLPHHPFTFDFDSIGMTKTNVYYPNKLRKHFGLHDQVEKDAATTRASSSSTSSTTTNSKGLVPMTSKGQEKNHIDHNNKQLMRLTENSFFERMRQKRHKYSMGTIYQFPSPIEEEHDDDGKKTIHLFCPFIYPMLPNENGDDSDAFAGLDEDTRIKIHVPVQMLNRTTNNKVIRLAEITGENMSLSESYFELDAALTPTNGADGTIKSDSD